MLEPQIKPAGTTEQARSCPSPKALRVVRAPIRPLFVAVPQVLEQFRNADTATRRLDLHRGLQPGANADSKHNCPFLGFRRGSRRAITTPAVDLSTS